MSLREHKYIPNLLIMTIMKTGRVFLGILLFFVCVSKGHGCYEDTQVVGEWRSSANGSEIIMTLASDGTFLSVAASQGKDSPIRVSGRWKLRCSEIEWGYDSDKELVDINPIVELTDSRLILKETSGRLSAFYKGSGQVAGGGKTDHADNDGNSGKERNEGKAVPNHKAISLRTFPHYSCILSPKDKVQLQVIALLGNGMEIDVTHSPSTIYSSSNAVVLVVSSSGVVGAIGSGRGLIRAEYSGQVSYSEILADTSGSVKEIKPLFGVRNWSEMMPEETAPVSTATLAVGDEIQLSVMAQLSAEESCYISGNKLTLYRSENSKVAKVDAIGRILAIAPGVTRIRVKAMGRSTSALVNVTASGDTIPPVTEIQFSSPVYISPSGNIYLSTSTRVYLSAIDPVIEGAYSSGVSFTGVSIDNVPEWSSGFLRYIPFGLHVGRHVIYFTSWDEDGNEEEIRSSTVSVDATAPTIGFEVDEPVNVGVDGTLALSTSAVITLTAQDVGPIEDASGVSRIMYSIDSPYSLSTAAQFLKGFTLPIGAHTIVYAAIDNVGNQSDIKVLKVDVGNLR